MSHDVGSSPDLAFSTWPKFIKFKDSQKDLPNIIFIIPTLKGNHKYLGLSQKMTNKTPKLSQNRSSTFKQWILLLMIYRSHTKSYLKLWPFSVWTLYKPTLKIDWPPITQNQALHQIQLWRKPFCRPILCFSTVCIQLLCMDWFVCVYVCVEGKGGLYIYLLTIKHISIKELKINEKINQKLSQWGNICKVDEIVEWL